MRRIVSDTGPIIHLMEAQAISLLHLAGEVLIPAAVNEEMADRDPSWAASKPTWIAVESVEPASGAESAAWQDAGLLHAGEAEAIALARQVRADWLLTDDAAARLFGEALGLEVHGSLGVVLWAAATGRLSGTEAEETLARLAQSSLWLSRRVLAEARSALAKMARRP